MITITIPTQYVITGGAFKDGALDILLTETGVKRFSGNDITTYSNIPPDVNITIAEVLGLIQLTGTIEGLPMFIKMSNSQYALEVPNYVPEYIRLDENEQPVTRVWSEWHDDLHEHKQGNDSLEWMVPGNSFGIELSGNVIAQLYNAGYTNIYNLKEYRAILADSNSNFYTGE